MAANTKTTLQDVLMVAFGVGLVYGAVYFIMSADTRITWTLVWQVPFGIVAVGAGLLIYGGAIWQSAKREHGKSLEAGNPK